MKRLQLRFMLVVLYALYILIHGVSIQDRDKTERYMHDLSEKLRDKLARGE